MAIKTKAVLTSEKNTVFADNDSGDITEEVMRDQQQDMIDSPVNLAETTQQTMLGALQSPRLAGAAVAGQAVVQLINTDAATTVNTFTGAVDPNGNVVANPGDLYIRKSDGDSAIYVYSGATPDNDEWSVLQKRSGHFYGAIENNIVPQVIPDNDPVAIVNPVMAFPPAENFNFSDQGNNIVQYDGPTTNERRLILLSVTLQSDQAGEDDYYFTIHRSRSAGPFVQVLTGTKFAIRPSDFISVVLVVPTDLQNGDQFRPFIQALEADDDVLIDTLEMTLG